MYALKDTLKNVWKAFWYRSEDNFLIFLLNRFWFLASVAYLFVSSYFFWLRILS